MRSVTRQLVSALRWFGSLGLIHGDLKVSTNVPPLFRSDRGNEGVRRKLQSTHSACQCLPQGASQRGPIACPSDPSLPDPDPRQPENIMLRPRSSRKVAIIDFGTSCFADATVLTYLQSRFYRSPEIILGVPYDAQVDMWSLGCVLAELYTGQPLFCGACEKQQIASYVATLGRPPPSLLRRGKRSELYFDGQGQPHSMVAARGVVRPPGTHRLEHRLPGAPPEFVQFVRRCLEWDPKTRLKAADALSCKWLRRGKLSMTANDAKQQQPRVLESQGRRAQNPSATRHTHSKRAFSSWQARE